VRSDATRKAPWMLIPTPPPIVMPVEDQKLNCSMSEKASTVDQRNYGLWRMSQRKIREVFWPEEIHLRTWLAGNLIMNSN
jgi:hypothetical protein